MILDLPDIRDLQRNPELCFQMENRILCICSADAEQQNAKRCAHACCSVSIFASLRPCVFAFCFFIHLIWLNNYDSLDGRHCGIFP